MCDVVHLHYTGQAGTMTLGKPLTGIRRAKLNYAVVPNTAYQLTGASFRFSEDSGAGIAVSIPDGNYNALTFAQIVEDTLNANTGLGRTYTVDVDQTTGKATYTPNAGTLSFDLFGSPDSLKKHLGFVDFDLTPPSTSLESTHVVAAGSHILDVFVKTNLAQAAEHNAVISNGSTSNILWSVPLTEASFGIVYHDGSTTSPIRCNPNHQPFYQLTFELEDKWGNSLDLNGHEISLSIELELDQPY